MPSVDIYKKVLINQPPATDLSTGTGESGDWALDTYYIYTHAVDIYTDI